MTRTGISRPARQEASPGVFVRMGWGLLPATLVGTVLGAGLLGCTPELDESDSASRPSASTPAPARLMTPTDAESLSASADDGEGRVRLSPPAPVVAGTLGSWTVEWEVGPSGFSPGDGIVLQISPFWHWSPPRVNPPTVPGFTTLHCSRVEATFSLAEGAVPMTLVARMEDGELEPGDLVAFTYGDTTIAGPQALARADRYAEEFEELLIKTDGNGDGFFVAVENQPVLTILPAALAQLALCTPSLALPETPFRASVSPLDAVGNWTSFPAGELRIERRNLEDSSEVPTPLTRLSVTSGRRRVNFEAVLPEGLWRLEAHFDAHLEEDATARGATGMNEAVLVEADPPFATILWGDIHAHSALSDGTGSPEEILTFARDVSGLDVACVTDHDAHGLFPLEGDRWRRVREATAEHNEPGRFVTFLAYEWTSWTYGHRNVYYPSADGEVFSFLSEESDTPQKLWDRIAPYGGVTIPHHPGGGPVPVDWSILPPPDRETVVEICSIHGSSEAYGVERGIYRPQRGHSVRDALDRGHRLGILAAGDTHDGHPGRRSLGAPSHGLAAFRAADRTREAVWEALLERRVYGTSGPRILLATRWGDFEPGEEVGRFPEEPLFIEIVSPEPIEVVELVDSNGVLASSFGGGRRSRKRFENVEPRGEWLYVRVAIATGDVAWESPFWLAKGTQ